MLDLLINFLSIWAILVFTGFILIFFRSDAITVGEDIDTYFYNKPISIKAGMLLLFVCILPLSIPYSIANIAKRKK
jgi:hypothetical protein